MLIVCYGYENDTIPLMNTADRFISNYNIMFMDDVEEVVADAGTESETSEAVVAEEATEVA